jgi:hypothetical protein
MNATAPYRVFSDAEIDELLVADTIEELMKLQSTSVSHSSPSLFPHRSITYLLQKIEYEK